MLLWGLAKSGALRGPLLKGAWVLTGRVGGRRSGTARRGRLLRFIGSLPAAVSRYAASMVWLKRAWFWGSVIFLGIGAGTAVFVWRIAETFHSPTVKWTAIGAVLAGAAFVVALIGLPAALYQLWRVRRELERLPDLLEKLKYLRKRGTQLFPCRNDPSTASELDKSIEEVATFIRTDLNDVGEEMRFRYRIGGGNPTERIDKTYGYLRNEALAEGQGGLLVAPGRAGQLRPESWNRPPAYSGKRPGGWWTRCGPRIGADAVAAWSARKRRCSVQPVRDAVTAGSSSPASGRAR